MSRSSVFAASVVVGVLVAGCGAKPVPPTGPVDLPAKPADFVDVFTWSQGVPAGARPLSTVFKGPHFSYGFGALAVRPELDESSGGLEAGPARAASGHEFLVLYRLQGDDTFAPAPQTPLAVDVVVGATRKRLPKPLERGTGLIVSVPVGADATLEVTDDKPYQFSVRNGTGGTPPSTSDNAPAKAGVTQVRWQDGTYRGNGNYQGQRTSGPLAVTLELGARSELATTLPGIGAAPARQLWLRLPDAKISTDDADLKLDLARSVSLMLATGKQASTRQSTSGLLFTVPDSFTSGVLTVEPQFPVTSTARWAQKPETKQIPLLPG
ncbi:hypothetical protein [Kibdelosporangium phytohabitans]|uniref:Uncharacterized protein n=1 Tax=Kibdelosporangium phytohabitans TaxID=860235 RepID=A0A0N9HWM8_9PSEU|nr:hypothetical protein [Kibdelosporangium phytohabitans]ALG06489.1 hypothetical protein AOZ06_05700 [Kibdelosporangium phytohabitans]MBE1467662.1 hypothetical protein [Kibdelosporangium phytohabitans]